MLFMKKKTNALKQAIIQTSTLHASQLHTPDWECMIW